MLPGVRQTTGLASQPAKGQPAKRPRIACKAADAPRIQEQQRGVQEPRTPLDILVRDCRFLHEHTGVDLLTTLAPVRDAHDTVVSVLNPLAKEKLTEDLQEEITQLQSSLQQAHEEVHELEQQLEDTIGYLSGVEGDAHSLQTALEQPSSSSSGARLTHKSGASMPSTSAQANPQVGQQRGGALKSGLEIPDTLRDFWYPVEFSSKLRMGKAKPFSLFSEPWRLMRNAQGEAICLPDVSAGRSTFTPDRPALSVVEKNGFVYVWTGSSAPSELPEDTIQRPPGFTVHSELELEVPVEHGLLLENLLDLAHAPFTHTSTFARGWPVPDAVRFHAARMLGGNWEPYPIDMSFEPPCMVLSTIGLAQPGKIERGLRAEACKKHLHQLHVCLPAGVGRTRLLYRMSMDFLEWTRAVPFIDRFWASIANQVLGEDLVLVKGQQERMLAGADVWANPVSYDKLGVRYRRWRNSLASNSQAEQAAARKDLVPMAAGEVFSLEEA